jgi:K+-transporting ATPase ATPase C chain
MASGGSNLGPNNPTLVDQIEQRKRSAALANGVDPGDVPPDALTASGSGLDPHISPEYARIQIRRVAAANHLSESLVADLVARHVMGPDLGFIGEPRVNVLEVNLELQHVAP